MMEFKLKDEFIKLGQLLKAVNIVGSGVEAKSLILDGAIRVNGEVVVQRGKKIHSGDIVSFEDKTIKVI